MTEATPQESPRLGALAAALRSAQGVPGLRLLLEAPIAIPLVVAVGVFLWWGASEGGFAPTTWYPGGLLLLALLVLSLVVIPLTRPPRLVLAAVGLLFAFAAWSYLSIAWADQNGAAWDGANLTLVYAVVFALFALWPLRPETGTLVLGAFALGVAAIGLIELLKANASSNAISYFLEARFSEPVGYSNGNVAFWFAAFWPAVFLASRREVHPLLRGAFLGSAVLLAGLAAMGASRGWLFALPPALLLFVALVPGRGRLLAALGVVGAAMLIVAPAALDVNEKFEYRGNIDPLLADAASAILIGSAIAVALGVLLAILDRRIRLEPARARRVSAATVAAAACVCVVAVGAVAVKEGDPAGRVSDAWTNLKEGGEAPKVGENRLTSLNTYRYDTWRVAWRTFEKRPLAGTGVDNFGREYRRHGRGYHEPRYPHSFELRTLSETGLIGTLLLLGAIGCALVATIAGIRRLGGLAGAAAGTALAAFGYWLLHGSVDWFWELPVLGAIAFAMLGLGVGLATADRPHGGPRRDVGASGWRNQLGIGVAATLAAACATGMALPLLAEREIARAGEVWRTNPDAAFKRLDRADHLNPLSGKASLAAGTYALRLGRLQPAEKEFREALERWPRDPYALLNLGAILAWEEGQDQALAFLKRALRENPRNTVTADAVRRIRSGKRVDPVKLNITIFEEGRRRVGLEP